jgi:4-hydroxybenzoate polyprenyltransferase
MRPQQWYKNILIFLPIIFVKEIFNLNALSRVILGFIALCFISSTNYILNDIVDRKKDRLHPEKRNRPLAAGIISVSSALMLAIILFFVSIWISISLHYYFMITIISLFILTQIYSYVFKEEPFLDITLIGVNFILRAISGVFIIYPQQIVRISPWLVLCPFFLALFLAIGKRRANVMMLGKKAQLHKKILKFYNLAITNSLMIITTTALLICYALFSFNSEFPNLIYTLPFAVYIMFRYMYLVESGSEIARDASRLIKDIQIVIAGAILAAVLLGVIYLL